MLRTSTLFNNHKTPLLKKNNVFFYNYLPKKTHKTLFSFQTIHSQNRSQSLIEKNFHSLPTSFSSSTLISRCINKKLTRTSPIINVKNHRLKHDTSKAEKSRDNLVPEVDSMTQKQWKFTMSFFLALLAIFLLYLYYQYQRDPLQSFADAFLRRVAGGSYRDYFYVSDPESLDHSNEHQWVYAPRDEGFSFIIPLHIFVRPGMVVKDEIKDTRGIFKVTDDSGTVISLLWGPSHRSATESKDDTVSRWPQKEGKGLKTEYLKESSDKVTAIMHVEADGKLFPEDSWVLYIWRNHQGKTFQISAKYRASSLVDDQKEFLLDKAQHLDNSLHID
eukprot:gb/GECH01000356.1/.p1 GENE.gb/GECH01000356.1/~~gb/GECH01000356.1/.p1  ORF type:complete len:332 (+),score=56.27 gb/GECH01000356.1/:1-996(+)